MESFSSSVVLVMAFCSVSELELAAGQQLNKTCCLNGGTCILGSFCACLPSFYGRNCELDAHRENCGALRHGAWLPRRCSLCKCWRGQLRCFPQAFAPGCEGHVMDGHLPASTTAEAVPSVCTTFLLAGIGLSIQSYY